MTFISGRADRYLLEPIAKRLNDDPITDYFYFNFNRADVKYLIVLGDRYETFTAAWQAFVRGIPIIHIHGGECTPNSRDDVYRDCITRMASLHFPPTLEAATRVYQINSKANVVPCGAVGAELAKTFIPDGRQALEERGFKLGGRTWLVTFHPQAGEDVQELIEAFKETGDNVTFTYPNMDPGNDEIIDKIRASRFPVYTELGMQTYLSLAKYSTAVVGNSSSGIIEIPVLGTPVINVGKRQEGRPKAEGIVTVPCNKELLLLHLKSQNWWPTSNSPYYIPGTIDTICRTIRSIYG